jgi:hypothetical protein
MASISLERNSKYSYIKKEIEGTMVEPVLRIINEGEQSVA